MHLSADHPDHHQDPWGADSRNPTDVASLLGLAAVWSESRGDPRICVAVLDGPVERSHACFQGALVTQLQTLVQGKADQGLATRHGTHVASVIFGQHGTAVSGVSPGCRGLIIPVFANGPGDSVVLCSQLDLARAIFQAVESGAHIINISGGQLSRTSEPEPILAKAISACAAHHVLIVAAAGNDGCECLHIPAAVTSVLSVGAMDDQGSPLELSNWGQPYRTQGILAPGLNIPGAAPGGGISLKSGTSFAAPIVSGLAALLLSIQLKLGRKPDPQRVRAALLNGADPCDPHGAADCRRFLAGRLNASKSMKFLVSDGEIEMATEMTMHPNGMTEATFADGALAQAIQSELLAAADSEAAEDSQAAAAVIASQATPGSAHVANSPIELRRNHPDLPARNARPRPAAPARIAPSDCGCGGGEHCTCGSGQSVQLVYALGKLGYDFGSEARRDRFVQFMGPDSNNPSLPANAFDPARMVSYLGENPYEAESLIWTLNLDATPIYAIMPTGPFATVAYERLREGFVGQLRDGVEMVSIPGFIAGSTTLMSGQVVPAIVPAVRGMFHWATVPLLGGLLGPRPDNEHEQAAYDQRVGGLYNFLNRVYYDLRNLGVTAEDRALNYSATNAFQVSQVIESATNSSLELDTITVKKSPICRPESDCYDVELGFFEPRNVNVASKIYRFTVDVSDVLPVTIGEVRAWSKRA
jgi:cyanobactin maturation PatA/PatG family protease